jgi:hypothetical protein
MVTSYEVYIQYFSVWIRTSVETCVYLNFFKERCLHLREHENLR